MTGTASPSAKLNGVQIRADSRSESASVASQAAARWPTYQIQSAVGAKVAAYGVWGSRRRITVGATASTRCWYVPSRW